MLSCILGYTSYEHVDEVILAFLSIFSLGKSPTIMYDYAQFIAEKMHEQFTNFPLKEFSNTLQCCFICFYITK